MLISHRKQFIYTKTLKTAGTSVELYFEKYCMPDGVWKFQNSREMYVSTAGIIGFRGMRNVSGYEWYNHMPASEIREKVGDSIWDNYFKFCVIRNPFDRLVSGFFYYQQLRHGKKAAGAGDLIVNFRRWVKENGHSTIDRDKYLINGQICLDYLIRYEELEKGIRHVCDILELPFEPDSIPYMKAGFRGVDIPLKDFYDFETVQIVTNMYKFELHQFNYSVPE